MREKLSHIIWIDPSGNGETVLAHVQNYIESCKQEDNGTWLTKAFCKILKVNFVTVKLTLKCCFVKPETSADIWERI